MKRLLAVWLIVAIAWLGWLYGSGDNSPLPSFHDQACSLPSDWLTRIQRGYNPERSGDISIVPKQPAYMASGAGGTTHSGPWPYLQEVPLVFYGPGFVPASGDVDRPVTMADIAPTTATLLKGSFQTADGAPLEEVARLSSNLLTRPAPSLIVTVVWDGGGWNVLEQWPDDWPNLARIMRAGVSFTAATVGSSPSVTPSVHTTLGTGVFPDTHGITGIPLRDENGRVVDSFVRGESSRFIAVPTIAERWDEQRDNEALVGMVGYEPWHLGMIGQGTERSGGDRDDAVWLDVDTNEWITNPDHYRLPLSILETEGLEADLEATDRADGENDGAWRNRKLLTDPSRMEEVPGFIAYHERALENLIRVEGYGRDLSPKGNGLVNLVQPPTDLLYTNFKQIDRLGHYFGMSSPEVHDALIASDRALGDLLAFLDDEVGQGRWVLVLTADHGQQPDAEDVDGYGIDPNVLRADIEARFGPIVTAVWASEIFLDHEQLQQHGVTVEEVARYVGDYRLIDNSLRPDVLVRGRGEFRARDRLYSMAIPSDLLPDLAC